MKTKRNEKKLKAVIVNPEAIPIAKKRFNEFLCKLYLQNLDYLEELKKEAEIQKQTK